MWNLLEVILKEFCDITMNFLNKVCILHPHWLAARPLCHPLLQVYVRFLTPHYVLPASSDLCFHLILHIQIASLRRLPTNPLILFCNGSDVRGWPTCPYASFQINPVLNLLNRLGIETYLSHLLGVGGRLFRSF